MLGLGLGNLFSLYLHAGEVRVTADDSLLLLLFVFAVSRDVFIAFAVSRDVFIALVKFFIWLLASLF